MNRPFGLDVKASRVQEEATFRLGRAFAGSSTNRVPRPRPATAADTDGPPPDGKYKNVSVEGRVVPLIHVKEGGTIVLVDTDGKRPVTWEEMYKRHGGDLPAGTFNAHKTAPNGTDDFSTVPIDRKGNWVIDGKGNITAR